MFKVRIENLNRCIKQHLGDLKWSTCCELRESMKFGCGIFAIRDIEPNEILFYDKPLLLGPTGDPNESVSCVSCYKKLPNDINNLCASNCGQLVCKREECISQHQNECQYLNSLKPKNPNQLSFTKMKALSVIRSQFLNEGQLEFLGLMQKNYSKTNKEIFFDDEFENFPQDKQILAILKATEAAINTNALKVLYKHNESDCVNLRGLYPIVSLMNHNCTPNTRRDIDGEFLNRVVATRKIYKNDEIFTTYSQLLWSTPSRRIQLLMSKQFLCACNRCCDPTEKNSNISAIRCQNKKCSGYVLPVDSTNFKSDGKCNQCEMVCNNKRFLQIQEIAASMTKGFLSRSKFTLSDLVDFIETRLSSIIPSSSQFVLEMKLDAIWKYNATSESGNRFAIIQN